MKKSRAAIAPMSNQTLRRIQLPVYPFTAIVGQEEMKLSLLLNVIDPSIGGVLIMGHRGTGKSTAVRALADLLPQIARVRGCFYGCDPADEKNLCDDCRTHLALDKKLSRERVAVSVVDLPLGATEDRVCGTISIERALHEGVKAFEPGLLARANRGFLYIDEVNLLEDHLIDLLLDAAVTGRNVVEREGISIEHPARFVLVGSGNPEEGELRPQLLDRFGLHVEVTTVNDLDERVRIVEQRESFERDPESFRSGAEKEQESLRRRLVRARKNIRAVKLSRELLRSIAELCQQLKVDGHRGELTIARAARALAAYEGRKEVSATDIRRVATMALRHRLRRDPLEQRGGSSRIEQRLDKLFPPAPNDVETAQAQDKHERGKPPNSSTQGGAGGSGGAGKRFDEDPEGAGNGGVERNAPPALDARLAGDSFDLNPHAQRKQIDRLHSKQHSTGLRRSHDSTLRGRYVRASNLKTHGARIALDATLRAAAHQAGRGDAETRGRGEIRTMNAPALSFSPRPRVSVSPHLGLAASSLRYKRFKRKAGTLFILAVDTSGSMALNRIAQAKGALVRLLQQSYVKRDRVALVSFRGQNAEVLLPPSASVTRARRLLDELSVGGATPLAAGLSRALEIAGRAARQGAERIILLLFTDGRANVSLQTNGAQNQDARRRLIQEELDRLGREAEQSGVTTIVVDTQNRFTSSGEGQKLADVIGARYVQLGNAVDKLL
ncbi:MAG TPA: magnesium chelatase ATPase subunit I [Pyrinomonadaceae bacterium]|jgi:magnesium chelatase subunit D|nr:magnesium chelatase ATPase subunit I [Pyrinomonadaceae bacterium]